MLQLSVSASSLSSAAGAAGGVLSSLPAHVCALLLHLVEHRLALLVPDCTSVIVALIRASIHTLNSSDLPSAATQRTALALARLLTRLPAAMRHSSGGSSTGSGGLGSSDQLSAALPALLHDYLHACRLCSDVENGAVWQSVLQPAVASLLQVMSEHDITATHLMMPSAERELLKPIVAHYKRELRYRGQ